MKVAGYIEATQRGFAYGLHRNGKRIIERYVRVTSTKSIDEAYREAQIGESQLLYTFKKRPDIIRRNSNEDQLTGNLYN